MEVFSKFRIHDKTTPILPRPSPMKVLCLGLSRTGTLSTYTALGKLGYNSYHYFEIAQNQKNEHWTLWSEALKAKYEGVGTPWTGNDFDRILWNYDAVTDAPCCLFADELLRAYPDAKVVLTIRSPETWLASMRRTFLEIISWRSWTLLSWLDREFSWHYWPLLNRIPHVWSQGKPAWKPSSDSALLESFNNHNSHIQTIVPKDRLLVFHPSEGWDPLCKFLHKEIPEEPFPHINDGLDVVIVHKTVYWVRWTIIASKAAFGLGTATLVVGAAWYLQKQRNI